MVGTKEHFCITYVGDQVQDQWNPDQEDKGDQDKQDQWDQDKEDQEDEGDEAKPTGFVDTSHEIS